MTIFYFTATGNSLAVAKRVGGELISIPKALKDGEYFFAVATYGFFPGNTIRDFTKLKRMKEFRDAA